MLGAVVLFFVIRCQNLNFLLRYLYFLYTALVFLACRAFC